VKKLFLVKLFMVCFCGLADIAFSANSLIPAKTALTPENLLPIKTPFVSTSSFAEYVKTCREELAFDFIPQMDCRDINFRPRTNESGFQRSNDWVSHLQVNANVDVLFACRWVEKNTGFSGTASGEMLIHNRANGNTCFFKLKVEGVEPEPERDTSTGFLIFPKARNGSFHIQAPTTNPASPTAFNAEQFWEAPETIVDNDSDVCTRCHSAGPYIASPEIVSALAQYGLINDGHDVHGRNYKAVGIIFEKKFNSYINQTIQTPSSSTATCASLCHLVGGNSTKLNTTSSPTDATRNIIMPSINRIIDDIVKGHMPPNDPFSDYRWINRDTPADAGDYERLSAVKTEFNEIYESCKTPEYMQAHEVDNTLMMTTNDFVDVINTFNLHDGLICLNADQANGRCNSYETRYRCNGKWTSWQSHDSPGSTGDHEKRSSYSFPATCTAPYAIQARYYIGNEAHIVNGSPDRLYQFDKNGLVCRNKDQPSGESCHNYTVRFICP
jgi:Mucin-2 protein WxxW repeating region